MNSLANLTNVAKKLVIKRKLTMLRIDMNRCIEREIEARFSSEDEANEHMGYISPDENW